MLDGSQLTGKVLAVASGGGHWLEMCRLYPAFEKLDVAFVSDGERAEIRAAAGARRGAPED